MAADFNKPVTTDAYANVLAGVRDNDAALAVMQDPAMVTPDNTPEGAIRWTSAANKFQRYASSVWGDMTLANNISGNAATATTAGACSGNAATATTAAACSGNAATATTLQNARTIDGQSFNGSANISVVAPATHAATSKATPVDADEMPLSDSAAAWVLKKLTWANLKATLKAYFDTLYAAAGASSEITGVVKDYIGTTAPSGYVLASGRTIGNAASGATERANADTEALFTLLWNSMGNSEAAVSGGRGASAAADYAANKTIALPDARGRTIAGKDNMGGTTASRLTSAGGIVGTTLGVAGGTETHTLVTGELPSHTHTTNAGTTNTAESYFPTSPISVPSFSAGTASGAAGSGSAHKNTQPTLVLNKIIKL